jgi:hypothetical protein
MYWTSVIALHELSIGVFVVAVTAALPQPFTWSCMPYSFFFPTPTPGERGQQAYTKHRSAVQAACTVQEAS